jgi:hypothetical protein
VRSGVFEGCPPLWVVGLVAPWRGTKQKVIGDFCCEGWRMRREEESHILKFEDEEIEGQNSLKNNNPVINDSQGPSGLL